MRLAREGGPASDIWESVVERGRGGARAVEQHEARAKANGLCDRAAVAFDGGVFTSFVVVVVM